MPDEPTDKTEAEKVLPRMLILVDREERRTPLQFFIWRSYAKVVEWLDINSFPFFIGGFLLNSYFFVNEISALNAAFEGLYAVIILHKIIQLISRRKQTGTVIDADTKRPLDLATVRVAAGERFVQVRVTDKAGLFFVIVQPGHYTVFCSKGGYETASKKITVAKSKNIKALKLDFALRKTKA